MLSSASEKKRCKAAGSGSSVVEKQLWKDRNMFCLQDNIANKTSVLWHNLRNDNLSEKLLWKILVARQLFPALPAQHSQKERKDHAPNSATAFRKKSQNMLRLQDSNPTVTLQSEDFLYLLSRAKISQTHANTACWMRSQNTRTYVLGLHSLHAAHLLLGQSYIRIG